MSAGRPKPAPKPKTKPKGAPGGKTKERGNRARTVLRPVLRVLAWIAALAWIPVTLATLIDLDVWWGIPSTISALPMILIATAVVGAVALLRGHRRLAGIALLGVLVLALPRIDRVTAERQPRAEGPGLVVISSNVHLGTGNANELVKLVRTEDADALALQEDTPAFIRQLEAAGIRELLPHAVIDAKGGAAGTSLYTRAPIQEVPTHPSDRHSVGGTITLPGGAPVHLRSSHPPPPISSGRLKRWKAAHDGLLATARSADAPAVLAGDFNATLDHHPLRRLIDAGYRDAARQTGDGWRPTFSKKTIVGLTLDHILVPEGVAVRRTDVRPIDGTDHHALVTTLQFPR